ncbi:MAG: MFS transporter [Thermodesulfovibrionales bacterium]|nr:MFS transporter [Thermodesulfovibrionales bacterium]
MRPDRRIISWCLFDFANSSYSAVIAAVIFPVYYANQVVGGGEGDLWWGRAVSLSMAIVALSSPLLGGIADFGGIRKRLLFIYTLISILAVSAFSFLKEGMALEGFILVVVANVGMEGGIVFYNSFLTQIAKEEYQGRVSSWGYAVGYAGSILSLLIALPFVTKGFYSGAWLTVALMFFVFSIPAFLYLPRDTKEGGFVSAASRGMRFTWRTFSEIWRNRESRKFLIAYLIYEDGVNTVIVFSSLFAAATFGFQSPELIGLYITVQVTALAGAFLMARPIDFWGPKKVVSLTLVLWTLVTVFAFFAVTKLQFWLIASVAGIGLGSVQAATRAFFAQFIPEGHESEYFGVYSMVGKSSAVIGPLLFGYISTAAGSQRPAILVVALFFLSGLIIVRMIKGGGPNVKKLPVKKVSGTL